MWSASGRLELIRAILLVIYIRLEGASGLVGTELAKLRPIDVGRRLFSCFSSGGNHSTDDEMISSIAIITTCLFLQELSNNDKVDVALLGVDFFPGLLYHVLENMCISLCAWRGY